jgi:hypothetical protein
MAVRDDFAPGEVLAAADLNDTFASKLPYSYGTATPSTTTDGFLWYDENTTPPTPKYWDGSSFAVLALTPGLQFIVSETLTAASSVSINNCFSATYDNYRIIFAGAGPNNTAFRLRWRASGSDNSTASSYTSQYLQAESTSVSAALLTDSYSRISNGDDSETVVFSADVASPFLAKPTSFVSFGNYPLDGPARVWLETGRHNQSTSYDGFTFYVASGTITGNIRVYGYRNS